MSLDIEALKELTRVYVCAGPPLCSFEGDEAVRNAQDGCTLCTRIAFHPDGSETHYHLPAH